MSLTGAYVQPTNRIPDLFNKIRDGQAPPQFTTRLLVDWGFKSVNDRAFISMLKSIGFLTQDGKPTSRYNDYRDHSRSKQVMADALKEAYADLFLIKEHPTETDREAIEGKFKSYHNASDNVAQLMTRTFLSLAKLADFNQKSAVHQSAHVASDAAGPGVGENRKDSVGMSDLHYNIQIHLPATKDLEVYNSIFKALREHLFEN